MLVEQALFTSALTQQARGYHLVARSSGVTDRMAKTLAMWSPTHDSLTQPHLSADSINFFQLDQDWSALTRTVRGESEYSNRGGLRLETNILVFRTSQLSTHDYNPLSVAALALALGHLRLRAQAPRLLDSLQLPSSAWATRIHEAKSADGDEDTITKLIRLTSQSRVMVVGAESPRKVVGTLLQRLPADRRAGLTFSTGLRPSLHRPFRVQFLPQLSENLREKMAAAGIICLDVERSLAM